MPDACTVCGNAPAAWANRLLLGCDDRLCETCLRVWYDEGVTLREALRQRSLELQAAKPK